MIHSDSFLSNVLRGGALGYITLLPVVILLPIPAWIKVIYILGTIAAGLMAIKTYTQE